MTVVIVDDDKDDVEMFCKAVLEVNQSINCISFSSGRDLLSYLTEADPIPEYIFLDLVMPGMSGVECIKELRKNLKFRETKLIAYSGLINHNQFEAFKILDTTPLFKPASYKILVEEVKAILTNE